MAVIVEDGSIVAGANSYASVAQADAYQALRSGAAWIALPTSAKEAALIKATDYVEQMYSGAFKGRRVSSAQSLSWPRIGAIVHGYLIASNVVPAPVVNAAIELAAKAAVGELLTDEARRVKRKKVDVIEVEYSDYASAQKRYPAIERGLSPYLTSSVSGGIQVARLERV